MKEKYLIVTLFVFVVILAAAILFVAIQGDYLASQQAERLLQDAPYALRVMEFDESISRTVSIATRSLKTCSVATKLFIECTQKWVEEFLNRQKNC